MDTKDAPPPYNPYPVSEPHGPPQAYPSLPPQQGYPTGGYGYAAVPPPAQYAPQPAGAYQPNYAPPQTTVIEVGPAGAAHTHTTVYVERNVNHCLHCCITLFFPPWIFVWIFLCLTN